MDSVRQKNDGENDGRCVCGEAAEDIGGLSTLLLGGGTSVRGGEPMCSYGNGTRI